MAAPNTFDVVVVGAGTFGAWTAWHLEKRNQRVALLDAYGAANARASSGGETRVIRMGVPFQALDQATLRKSYPQLNFDGVKRAILESHSGVLMARRAVAVVVADAAGRGVSYRIAKVEAPSGAGRLASVKTSSGETIAAGSFVFAPGPWLGKVFPALLGSRVFPTRQEVFFFGVPAGDTRFATPKLSAWLFMEDEFYGTPDIEGRGLKIAWDRHGKPVDPDAQSRVVTATMTAKVRTYAAYRFPALKGAPIVETRVCQYENTSNGDFLVDRHPEIENLWLVGGGSGHGFKHGPALGEYVAGQVLGNGRAEPRFALATKATVQRRAVY